MLELYSSLSHKSIPTYFRIAERRIAEAQLQAPLFPHEREPQAVTLEMFA